MTIGAAQQFFLGASKATGGGAAGYQIERSLRFNSSDSAYLGRTPASAGNRKTFTFALWVKRSGINSGNRYLLLSSYGAGSTYTTIEFEANIFKFFDGGAVGSGLATAAVMRDPSAWMHICVSVDTTQSIASNRIKIYVNGSEQTLSGTQPSQNSDLYLNQANSHIIGAINAGGYFHHFDGLLADVFFCDGNAYDPSYFTETDATTGQLIPKAFSGSYGTNGFHLDFADNSAATATTLGKDTSGNSNNWTPNNLSVTAGAGNDSLVDVPTNGAQTDTGVGGEVRGNYCVLNPLQIGSAITLSNGNLDLSAASSGSQRAWGTIGVSTGKWYFEYVQTSGSFTQAVGIKSSFAQDNNNNYLYSGSDGNKINASGSNSSYGATWALNDVVGVAFDLDNGTITFYKNGTSQGQAFSGITAGTYFPFVLGWAGGTFAGNVNFGQRPFAYTAPSGFKALCTANLPAPLVTKPSTVFDTLLWTGNGSARSITGLGFNPDLVWIKSRSAATDHELTDSVRGTTKSLSSNLTAAEATDTGGLTAFNSDGFSLGTDTKYNNNAATYAGWCWDAGSSTVTNTQGSITASLRANPTAGFSIVSFNSGSSGAKTIGHGLGIAPSLIIAKNRDGSANWTVYHSAATTVSQFLMLNSTNAVGSSSNIWGSTAPTSTVFGFDSGTNQAANANIIAYCFAPVVGYSAMSSYVSTGTSDNAFQYCGFRPRFILLKNASVTNSWVILDAARSTYNAADDWLGPNSSSAEDSNNAAYSVDFLSNGFKVRSGNGILGNSGDTVIWAAFAESPFNYSRAR